MVERIRLIMEDYAKLSQQDFAARIGISAASLSGVLTGRSQPSNKHVMGIHQAFPEINVNWLLFGEGNMLAGKGASEASEGENAENGLALDLSETQGANDTPLFAQSAAPTGANLFTNEMGVSVAQNANSATSAPNNKMRGTARMGGNSPLGGIVMENDGRKIKEIRVFFSNGTYESFVPSNK